MDSIFEMFRNLKGGISKNHFLWFVFVGATLIYFPDKENSPEMINNLVNVLGVFLIFTGVVIGVAANLISLKIDVYENIIKQYR